MKLLILALMSFSIFAADVDGTITYRLPNGELVERDVTLNVPSMGQGEVILFGDNFEWRTTEFSSFKKKGKTIFLAIFKTEFMSFKSTIAFKGTYLQGSNKIIYSGNFYKRNGHEGSVEKSLSDFEHQGLFHFSFDR